MTTATATSATTDPTPAASAASTTAKLATAPPQPPVQQIDPKTGQLKPEFIPKPKWTAEQQAAL